MPGLRVLVGCLLLGTALTSGAALAQENLNRLQDFRTTGTDLTLKTVPQDPAKLAQLRKNLEKVKLPPGFKIDLYAIVPDARHMAVGRKGRRRVRRHAQDRGLGGHRPRQGPRRRRGQGVRAPASTSRCRTASASPRTASCSSSSTTACWLSPPPSSSTRARTWRSARWSSRAADPARTRNPSTTAPGSAGSARTTSSTSPWASPSTCRPRRSGALQRGRHRRHHPHGPRRQEPRGLRARHPQLGRHGLQPGQRRALVHRQPGRRHGRRHAARRTQPHHQPGPELRLPWYGGGTVRTDD